MTAVKDFIPIDDAKKTVEKEVKHLPSVAERTTIEVPGKPSSATFLEDLPKKKKITRKRKDTTSTPKIVKPKSNTVLIITEKPQAALKIASALGSAKKFSENNVSYYELTRDGKEITVASAVGHLLNLNYVKGQRGYPIFELEWRPSYEKKNSAFTKRYFNLLLKLTKKSERIIIATDYDIEGEVIGWNVLRFIAKKQTSERMKYSTLTKNELQNSYSNLKSELDWGHAYAGESRHILDWLYGINLSRALMAAIKTSGSFKILSIGRVQGPALKIIVDKEREIANFKSEPFWQVFAHVKEAQYKHPKDIFKKEELEKFKNLKEGEAETKTTEEKIQPPHPFDLTTLQREAYRLHKIPPSQTLAISQKLYLDGLISYPRTSSQKIPDSIEPKKILKALKPHFPQIEEATRTQPIEGGKSDPAHPSIYPTGETGKMTEDKQKLYNLIVRRFVSAFYKDAITENKRVKITTKEKLDFKASGLKIKEEGWTKIYPSTLQEKEVQELNGKVKINEIKFEEKETQPPKRFTPTSLITILEKKNLGTKATRSMIIETLFNRGYLDGKSIKATPLGIKLIEALEKYSPIIIDENLTRKMEEEMEKIQGEKTQSPEKLKKMEDKIIEHARKTIIGITKEFQTNEVAIGKEIQKGLENFREQQREDNTIIKCPTCNKGDLRILYSRKTRRYFAACSAYPECKQTYSLPPDALIKKSENFCEECNYPKLLSIKKGKRPWEFCFNPECPSNKKRLEEYRQKHSQDG